MDLWVLDDAYAGSRVNFIFWSRHLVSNMDILLNYGNPELKNIYFSVTRWSCQKIKITQDPA